MAARRTRKAPAKPRCRRAKSAKKRRLPAKRRVSKPKRQQKKKRLPSNMKEHINLAKVYAKPQRKRRGRDMSTQVSGPTIDREINDMYSNPKSLQYRYLEERVLRKYEKYPNIFICAEFQTKKSGEKFVVPPYKTGPTIITNSREYIEPPRRRRAPRSNTDKKEDEVHQNGENEKKYDEKEGEGEGEGKGGDKSEDDEIDINGHDNFYYFS